jgi:hypothetical protein
VEGERGQRRRPGGLSAASARSRPRREDTKGSPLVTRRGAQEEPREGWGLEGGTKLSGDERGSALTTGSARAKLGSLDPPEERR